MIIGKGIRQYVKEGKQEIKKIFGWCPWHLIYIKTRLRTETRRISGRQVGCRIKLDTKYFDENYRLPWDNKFMRTSVVVHEITHKMQDAHAIKGNLKYYISHLYDNPTEEDSKIMNDRLLCLFRDSETSEAINRILEFPDGYPKSTSDESCEMTDEILPKAVELIYQYESKGGLKGEYNNEYKLAKKLVSKYKEELASPLVVYLVYFIKIIPFPLVLTFAIWLIAS